MLVHDAGSSIPAFEAFVWGVQAVLNAVLVVLQTVFGARS
jgi:hypothetical protein